MQKLNLGIGKFDEDRRHPVIWKINRVSYLSAERIPIGGCRSRKVRHYNSHMVEPSDHFYSPLPCLLYTSDAADDLLCVDLGGRRIIKKKKNDEIKKHKNIETRKNEIKH
eukprot:TRINITY_DN18465_c0_g1_i2.p2 TRINITY_DN18465_c0_g1~~TRINITY_DN18465_c0_g1_i2.p2  ORF type:complete len:110 (+),score=33.44 TRINITY_DN18465_c0_g1_i2:476-805(+)